MNILLFGIYGVGYQALAALQRHRIKVVGVVTKASTESAQEDLLLQARTSGLPLLLPDSPDAPGFLEVIRDLSPDLIAVAGYPKRLPRELLQVPPMGCINAHLSLLPKYRGPCPWKWALIRGEQTTGATVHIMTSRFDRGPILAQRETLIGEEDTGGTLFHRLSTLGAELLANTLVDIEAGKASCAPQDETAASYQGPPTDSDARIRWSLGSREILNLVRGLCPRPGAWTSCDGHRIRILRVSLGASPRPAIPPGTIVGRTEEGVSVATGDGTLVLREMTREGIVDPRPEGKEGMDPLTPGSGLE
jgi:methionyl-tRNA formyltransferase